MAPKWPGLEEVTSISFGAVSLLPMCSEFATSSKTRSSTACIAQQLLKIELNETLGYVACAVIQQRLRRVVTEAVAEPADDRRERPPQIVWRELDAALRHHTRDLVVRLRPWPPIT